MKTFYTPFTREKEHPQNRAIRDGNKRFALLFEYGICTHIFVNQNCREENVTDNSKISASQTPRAQLIRLIAKGSVINIDEAKKYLDIVLSSIAKRLEAGDRLFFPELGSFVIQDIPGRKGRNPRTGEPLEIKPYKKIRFLISTSMKNALNPGRSSSAKGKKAPAKKPKK